MGDVKKRGKRLVSLLMAFLIAFGAFSGNVADVFAGAADIAVAGERLDPEISTKGEVLKQPTDADMRRLQAVLDSRQHKGLIGFEGEYALDGGNASVIVLFNHDPAQTQVVEAQSRGGANSRPLA